MKFSIIIPTYNVEAYINQCLNSIMMQTFKDYEVIIVDDGSTDHTLGQIKTFSFSQLILLENNTDTPLGPGPGRNKGLDIAQGDYILFIDADDWYTDSSCLEYLNEHCHDKDVVFYDFIYGPYGQFGINDGNKNHNCAVWFKAWRRSFIQDIRFKDIMVGEDFFFTEDVLAKNPTHIVCNKPIVYYNHPRDGSITSSL